MRAGLLPRLDLAWSRGPDGKEYVQDVLLRHSETVRSWIADGAAIYVCGSLEGMASGVDQALTQILGSVPLSELARTARYRRDVY